MPQRIHSDVSLRAWQSSILLICLSYFIFECFFIPFEVLSADEFVFARHIYEYTFHIPYLDFQPYKSVIGHYLLVIPLFFSHTLFEPIFYIKEEIALLNTACIALTCYWGATLFDKRAVLLTMLALLANHYFLIYSTDLRVDMLTSWCCLFSLLAIGQARLTLGGLLLGLAFLISQKAMWYVIAINGSMLMCNPTTTFSLYATLSNDDELSSVPSHLPLLIILVTHCFPSIVLHNFFMMHTFKPALISTYHFI